ncbi:MAG: hypothetical protein IT325_12190 [Anaerolineae bacterium]|nr:hypothetical protein [Anaerolineae bacterium]
MRSTAHDLRRHAGGSTGASPATLLLAAGARSVEITLRRALQAEGHVVVTAPQLDAVLPALRAEHFDLVIIDAQRSPEASYDLCAAIKDRTELGYVPVVILAETDAGWMDDAPDLQPDALLLTPVDLRELHHTTRTLLRLKRQFTRLLPSASASRAHEIDVLRADIIRNVSHELSTPLLQVKTAIAMLLDPANLPARSGALDTMAREAAARLEEVVDNIQQLAQAHAISLAPFIAADALSGALRHLERSWTWQHQVGRIEVHNSAREAIVLGDRSATARLLQLLLENALKFSPPDTPVYLSASLLDTGRVWFGVEDSGIGIPPEEQEQIFEVFYQVDRSSRRRYQGAGTGLALAMLLAGGMETAIEVDSAPGEGSTFSFTLPLVEML